MHGTKECVQPTIRSEHAETIVVGKLRASDAHVYPIVLSRGAVITPVGVQRNEWSAHAQLHFDTIVKQIQCVCFYGRKVESMTS